MVPLNLSPPSGAKLDTLRATGTLMGKRYMDAASALEVLCTKPGRGSLDVSGESMTQKETKALPASD